MLNEGLLEKQVCLVTALKVYTRKIMQGIYWGLWGWHAVDSRLCQLAQDVSQLWIGHGLAMEVTWQMPCMPRTNQIRSLSRNLGGQQTWWWYVCVWPQVIKLVWFLRFGSQQHVVADHECSRPLQMKRREDWLNGFMHLSRLTRRVNLVFYSALLKGRLFRNELKAFMIIWP